MFDDSLILRQGLEYKARLPGGHIVHYLSKETAQVYMDGRGAEIIAPQNGPYEPECFQEAAHQMTSDRKLADYDALPCLRCGSVVKPSVLMARNAVRYIHDCPDGNRHGWTINEDGDVINELTT